MKNTKAINIESELNVIVEDIVSQHITTIVQQAKSKILNNDSSLIKIEKNDIINLLKGELEGLLMPYYDQLNIDELYSYISFAQNIYMLNYPLDLYLASMKFNEAFSKEFVSFDNVKKSFSGILDDFKDHYEDLGVISILSGAGGVLAFIIGTIIQIIVDIVNAFVTVVQYAYYGVEYSIKYISSTSVTEFPFVDPFLISSLIEKFDLDKFLSEDFPELIYLLKDFAFGIMKTFINEAESWGKSTARFIHYIISNSVAGTISFVFDKYDKSASIFQKIVWGYSQWYNLGTIFGPLIVDVILLFCSGGVSGIFSGVSKIGKIAKVEKLSKVFRFDKYAKILESLSIYNDIRKNIPSRLEKLIIEIFEKIWNSSGKLIDKIKDWISSSYRRSTNTNDLPHLDDVMKTFDTLYEKAEGINFFIFSLSMILGGEINSEGQIELK